MQISDKKGLKGNREEAEAKGLVLYGFETLKTAVEWSEWFRNKSHESLMESSKIISKKIKFSALESSPE